jgi:hypothetical protein
MLAAERAQRRRAIKSYIIVRPDLSGSVDTPIATDWRPGVDARQLVNQSMLAVSTRLRCDPQFRLMSSLNYLLVRDYNLSPSMSGARVAE